MTETELHRRLAPIYAECIEDQAQLVANCHGVITLFLTAHRELAYREGVESCCKRVCDRCRNPKEHPAAFRNGRWLHGDWACTASTIRGLPVERCLQ